MKPSELKKKKILITGAGGQLGKAFAAYFARHGFNFRGLNSQELNILESPKVEALIRRLSPEILINCAAYNDVEKAESEPKRALAVNTTAVENLSRICRARNIFLVHFSTDYVFDGRKGRAYVETDATRPLNAYGRSKELVEQRIRKGLDNHLIFRVSWLFGDGKNNFPTKLLGWAEKSPTLKISADEISVPTFTEDVVKVVVLSLEKELTGLFHLTNSGQASRIQFARRLLRQLGIKRRLVPVAMKSFPTKAERPLVARLSNQKISRTLKIKIPTWQNAVERYARHVRNPREKK